MLETCKTFVARNAEQLIQRLSDVKTMGSSSHTLLFSISPSPSLSETELGNIVNALSKHPKSIGCLSASIRAKKNEAAMPTPTICSIAMFDAQNATPFRSTIPGKEPTQVGRWHAFRKRGTTPPQLELPEDSTGINWESVWAKSPSKENRHSVAELAGLRPQTVKNILYLSDNASEGLSQYLGRFDQASKIGVVASSTPFVTGRPFTLFYDGGVHSSGAVGICFTDSRPPPDVWFPDLQEITGTLTVTSTEGNLIHTLNDQNPSRLILSALQNNGRNNANDVDIGIKDDKFFLGVFRDDKCYQMYNITAGDPSRGTISLQSDAAPEAGSQVKIYRKNADHESKIAIRSGIEVLTVSPEDAIMTPRLVEETDVSSVEGACLIPSENGFIVSRFDGKGCERPWKSTGGGGAILPWTLR